MPNVVQVRADAHGGDHGFVEPEALRDGRRVLGDTLTVTVRVPVRGFDRAPPRRNEVQVNALEIDDLRRNVLEIGLRARALEEAVRDVEQRQRILIAIELLIQHGQLARRFGFLDVRARIRRQLHGRAQSRFGQGRRARLAVHHAQEPIRLGSPLTDAELVEDAQRFFGALARVLVALAGEMDFRALQQRVGAQLRVADLRAQLEARREVRVGLFPALQVGADHA